jgi:hypothetical protein
VIDSWLLHDPVGRVPGQDFMIDRETSVGNRAIAELVIALPMPLPATARSFELLDDEGLVISH